MQFEEIVPFYQAIFCVLNSVKSIFIDSGKMEIERFMGCKPEYLLLNEPRKTVWLNEIVF